MINRLLIVLTAVAALAGTAAAVEKTPFVIGYLEIEGDPRYAPPRAYAGIDVRPRHRPVDGAALSIRESKIIGRALGLTFSLDRVSADTADGLSREMDRLQDQRGVDFFIVDGASDVLTSLADHAADRDMLLFNISEPDDRLRSDACAANLMHVIPSRAMLADAMAQFLVASRWKNILVLKGEFPADTALAQAFQASAKKYGLKVVDKRDFVLGNDPREREKNNIALLTAGVDYDAVFIADSLGQVGRYVPYQTALPRPVVGSEGLVAGAWNWAWERHGAPQLNQRFERRMGRRMEDRDWAAWAAVKAIVEAVARTGGSDFSQTAAYLKGPDMILDGYKGAAMSFRSWDNQLRQPLLIHTSNAVIERAPLEGFLHSTQYMDTLGYDAPENRCRF
jgi:ABC transporter substrate binding protein (PQQ-dependent alcohol dehydrogenase system)